jgi:two-component system cell cycle sensor histidine kinase/response regulator CckA
MNFDIFQLRSIKTSVTLFTLTISLMLFLCLLPSATMSAPLDSLAYGEVPKRVFVLNSFNRGYTWTDNMLRGIDDVFGSSGVKVESYVTFMDMKRIPPTPQYFQQLKELIREGYKGVRFDAVLACDNDAFEFAKKYRDELFPGVPVVFSSINDFDERTLEGRRDITGTSENTDYKGTIKIALQLLPATKKIVVVTDSTTTGKAHRSAVEKIRLEFPQSLDFNYISLADMTMDELAGKLSKLERDSIVLLLQHFRDKDGTNYTVQQSTPLLTKSSSVPVFVLTDIRIGLGALGGLVVSGYHHGEVSAQMVVKILKGADVKSIRVLLDSPNKYIFDYKVMERFLIPAKALPPESTIINRPDTALDLYKKYLVLVTLSMVALVGIIARMWREIKSRKRAEELLRESNEILSLFMRHSPIYTYIKEVTPTESRVLHASENFLEMVGIPGSEMVGKTMDELFPAEFAAKIAEDDWAVVSGGIVLKLDEDLNGRSYTTIKSPFTMGGKTFLAGFTIDITERKEAEEILKKIEERHRTIIGTAMDGFWLADEQGRLLEVNATYARMSGYTVQELLTMGIVDLEVNESASDAIAHNQKIMEKGEDRFVSKHRHKDGTIFDVEVSVRYLPLDGGVFVGFLRDITGRKQSEKELLESKEFLELTQRSAGAGLWAWDFASGELNWSPEQYQMFGFDPATGVPTFDLWLSVLHPDDLKSAESNIRDAIRDHTQLFNEYRIIKHSGEVRWINAIGQINYDNIGEPSRMSGICLDITERKKSEEQNLLLEQQFQQAQKLESLGVLSGGIAHDFNNILAVIIGYCSLTKMDYETAEQNIQEIEKAAERAAGLCRQMLAYAGKAQLSMSQINMWLLVHEIVDMLKATLPKNTVIKQDLSTNIPSITADASQIRQIVMNLIINASEAIGKEQGEILVLLTKTKIITDQPEKDYHGKAIPPGNYACLEVTDNGCGMDEETKWRIFEPFYTTKFTGRGLGMSAVLGIIKSHSGALQLFSQLGHGSTFKVYLPIQKSDSSRDEDLRVSIPSVPWHGSGTILLVEDEDQVRLLAKTFLQEFGFTVLEAVNGKDALELYQKNATDIRLVVTDMGMPVMDGYELFHELKKLKPELPIIVSSGYGDAEVSSRIGSDNIAGLISKPYNPNQLREVLKAVLG